MARSEQWEQGRRHGIKWAVEWLHARARTMNDPAALAILNSAAFHMGSVSLAEKDILTTPAQSIKPIGDR